MRNCKNIPLHQVKKISQNILRIGMDAPKENFYDFCDTQVKKCSPGNAQVKKKCWTRKGIMYTLFCFRRFYLNFKFLVYLQSVFVLPPFQFVPLLLVFVSKFAFGFLQYNFYAIPNSSTVFSIGKGTLSTSQ